MNKDIIFLEPFTSNNFLISTALYKVDESNVHTLMGR